MRPFCGIDVNFIYAERLLSCVLEGELGLHLVTLLYHACFKGAFLEHRSGTDGFIKLRYLVKVLLCEGCYVYDRSTERLVIYYRSGQVMILAP